METICMDPIPVARRGTVRKINQKIMLDLIGQYQPISRADLARCMGISRAMVGYLVDELLTSGIIYEGADVKNPRRPGRKPRMLRLSRPTVTAPVVAVTVGPTQTSVILSGANGHQIATECFDTLSSPDELIEELALRVRRLFHARGMGRECQKGVGLVVYAV